MPKLIMLVGVPGSGKSTWIKNQQFLPNTAVLNTDGYIENVARQQGKTYNEIFQDAIEDATRLFNEDLQWYRSIGDNVVLDQTNVTRKSRARKLRPFLDVGYSCDAYYFETKFSLDQVNELRPGKVIPSNVYYKMLHDLEVPSVDEGFEYVYHVRY